MSRTRARADEVGQQRPSPRPSRPRSLSEHTRSRARPHLDTCTPRLSRAPSAYVQVQASVKFGTSTPARVCTTRARACGAGAVPLLLDRRGARPTRDAAARPATDRSPDGTAGPAPAGRSTLREIIHLDLRRSPDPHPPAASLTPITHVPRYALLTIVF